MKKLLLPTLMFIAIGMVIFFASATNTKAQAFCQNKIGFVLPTRISDLTD